MGIDSADYDNDGWPDILQTDFSEDANKALPQRSSRGFTNHAARQPSIQPAFSSRVDTCTVKRLTGNWWSRRAGRNFLVPRDRLSGGFWGLVQAFNIRPNPLKSSYPDSGILRRVEFSIFIETFCFIALTL